MSRHVKGTLFVDYVRMLRARKDVEWSARLQPDDLQALQTRVDPDGWYSMETFERLGLVILNVVADGDLTLVREFGKASVLWLADANPTLVKRGDPRESLMRFQVLRNTYFDYPALEMRKVSDSEATLKIDYRMGDVAEEAAALQTMGFFEQLLKLAGAETVLAKFSARRWDGADETLLQLRWR